MSSFIPQAMGWIPDLPDPRDYTYQHDEVLSLLRRLHPRLSSTLPMEVDLSHDCEDQYFAGPDNQGPLNCSAICAVLGLVEYFERRTRGQTFEGSKRFLYKVTRNRLQPQIRVSGDTGADLRTTLKALAQFGVPPEEHWPYNLDRFDQEPSPFLYSLAKPFDDVRYFRLDQPNHNGKRTWGIVKSFLAAGFPVTFGFPVPTSLTTDPNIPYRPELDSYRGGQAALAIGYKVHRFDRSQDKLLVRTSWGSGWGANGNGWLPVDYLRKHLARDCWTLVSERWMDMGELERPKFTYS